MSKIKCKILYFHRYNSPSLGLSAIAQPSLYSHFIFLLLSPRNLVFSTFNLAVLYYESTTYIPFLYQSSKIRISFL
ncbi:Uncharacterised protein [Capnocytophaga ochracea]|uniref:Uncharacterized protein n=1 Tax=Capnocytophaga ochracea TaxID=1018 RepID=A0A2X2UZB0_CAPOC|nr:Uncharacterised protein [Capnocytophaga ochracea]